jgi:hypothetical protein
MMHVRVSLITADPPVLAGCLEYRQGEVRPVVENRPGSLGLSLLATQEPGLACEVPELVIPPELGFYPQQSCSSASSTC